MTSATISTHPGTRSSQQDAIKTPEDIPASLLNERGYLAVLCDGMGGMANGSMASSLCADLVVSTYYSSDNLVEDVPEFYKEIVAISDREISQIGGMSLGVGTCGTTMVSACVKRDELFLCSVGDSRIYIIRNNKIKALNREHNFAMELQEQVRKGVISQETADLDEKKHALVSYVGMGVVKYMDISSEPVKLMDNDIVLLCSDGISGPLDDEEILELVLDNNFSNVAELLVQKVINKNMEEMDNMSVVAIRYQKREQM